LNVEPSYQESTQSASDRTTNGKTAIRDELEL